MPKAVLKAWGFEVELEATEVSVQELSRLALGMCREATAMGEKNRVGFDIKIDGVGVVPCGSVTTSG